MSEFAGLIGPAMQIVGQAGSMSATRKAGRYNQQASDVGAQQRLIAGEVKTRQIERLAARTEGKQRAITGASNLVPTGTPEEIMLDSAMQADLEIQLNRKAAQIEAAQIRNRGQIAQAIARGNVAAGFPRIAATLMDPKVTTAVGDLWKKAKGYFDEKPAREDYRYSFDE